MASFRSTRSSRSRGFASLRLRSGSTSSKRGSGQGVEDDIASEADHPFVWALRKPAVLDWAKGLSDEAQRAEEENERMERLLVRLKRLHAENAELRTLLHEAIPDWGRRVGDAREQLGEPEAERLGDLLAEMRGLR